MSLSSLFLVIFLLMVTLVHHLKSLPIKGNRFKITNSYSKKFIHPKLTQTASEPYLIVNILKACIPKMACVGDLITRMVVRSQRGRMVA